MDRIDLSRLKKASAAEYSSSDSDGDEDNEYLMPSRNPLDAEFANHNPRKRRRTGRDAKESAALGIFGSDSEDERPGRGWKRKTLRNQGVSFVSSGTKAQDGDEEDDDDNDDDEDQDDQDELEEPRTTRGLGADDEEVEQNEEDDQDEEDEETGGVGLGFGGAAAAAGQGLGWAPPTQRQQVFDKIVGTPQKSFVKSAYDGSTPLGKAFTPSSAAEPVLKVRDDEPAAPRTAMPSTFGQAKGGKGKINPKSFGARMMAKMGYVAGQGLGKEGQGRNAIIEANLRPQNIGLGAVKEKTAQEREEEKRQARLRGEVIVDSDEEEKKKKAARKKRALAGSGNSGTASGASTPRRQKPKYVTMDEVKKVAPGLKIPDAFTPILDMTGPGQKMLTSSSGLMTPTGASAAAETTEAAESRKLARRAQNDFMAILEEWQSLQERKAYLELLLRQERQELEVLNSSVDGNRSVTMACGVISQPAENGEPDKHGELCAKMNSIINGLKGANNSISDDMLPQIRDELAAFAVAALHPTFKEFLQIWEPLEEPKPPFVDGLVSISGLLGLLRQPSKKLHRRGTATPYEIMAYNLWLPKVASAVREWNVRDSDQLLAVFEAWKDLMPGFVRAQLLDQDIVRKLEEAVAKWEPKRKKHHSLPHVWIFPWLQFLPARQLDPKSSTGLVADVKRKFRQLIDVWEFDRGVIPGFKQWKQVLRPSKSRDQWAPLIMNHVLPSMARYLKANFRVNPQDQEPYLEMLEGILKWLDIMSPSMIGEVVVAEVFPAWHEALYQWLLLDDANYEEIGQWFEWWHSEVFPAEIRELPSIAAEFAKGTALIEQALDLGDRAKTELRAPEKTPALQVKKSPSHEKHHRKHEPKPSPAVHVQQPEEITFRHVMEDWCQENDLQFIPERKRVHAEGPLYRVTARGDGKGGVLVYFKGDILYLDKKNEKPKEIRRDSERDLAELLDLVS